MKTISDELYDKLEYLGIITPEDDTTRLHNVGNSDYALQVIQPWTIWLAYPWLTAWDDDIIKRVLRNKEEANLTWKEARILDYKKIIHICQERIRQLSCIGCTEQYIYPVKFDNNETN